MVFVDLGDQTHGAPSKCGMFGSLAPTQLERDLGYNTLQNSAVCTGSTVNPPFVGALNSQIAKGQFPYFVNPPSLWYQDVWAQQFAVKTAGHDAAIYSSELRQNVRFTSLCAFVDDLLL